MRPLLNNSQNSKSQNVKYDLKNDSQHQYLSCILKNPLAKIHVCSYFSEIRGLCSMKCSSETIQNLPHF